jgi:ribonucleoside-triphosphate reductase
VVKNLVRKITSIYRLPYFSLTPTFSVCPAHGYLAGEQSKCPHCGSVCEIYSRIVGYLRPVQQWNDGKQSEFKQRRAAHFSPPSPCVQQPICPPSAGVQGIISNAH